MDTTELEQLRTVTIDTIEYIKRSDVADFYANIADKQATQFTILISVLCGIVVVLIGMTWWWNYKASKQQITDEISLAKSKLDKDVDDAKEAIKRLFNAYKSNVDDLLKDYEEKFNGFKGALQESVNKQIDKKTDESVTNFTKKFQDNIDELKNTQKEELKQFQDETTQKINEHQAELSRIFALHCESSNSFFIAANWWLKAAKLYKKIDAQVFVGISVNAILSAIEEIDIEKDGNDISDYEEMITDAQEIIPDILKQERDKIISKLKDLKSKKEEKK